MQIARTIDMLNKPPEYIPDYHALWRNLTLSLRDWQDTYEWVCRAEGTKMEIDIKYGESYFDKRGEELIKGSKEFKITGKIQDVQKEKYSFIMTDQESDKKIKFGYQNRYDHDFCVCWIDNGENKGIIKIIPYDLGFLSLDVGIGRSINNEYGEDWFGYLGTIFY